MSCTAINSTSTVYKSTSWTQHAGDDVLEISTIRRSRREGLVWYVIFRKQGETSFRKSRLFFKAPRGGKKLIFLTFWGFHFNRSPLWLQWKHRSYSPLSRHYESLSMHQRSIQVNHHSIHNHARLLRLRETLICSHGPSRVIFQEKALLLYLFMFRLQICACVCILKYTVRTLCVRFPASAADKANPVYSPPLAVQYFKYTFLDFKAYPRRRTRPLPRRSSTHDRTKGAPPPYWIHSLNMLNAAVDWTLRNYQNYLGHWQASPVVKRAMAVFGKTPRTGVCGREEGVYSSWVWVWCCSLNLLCFFFDKATLQIGNMKHFYWPQTRGSCHTRRRVWQRAQVVTHNR